MKRRLLMDRKTAEGVAERLQKAEVAGFDTESSGPLLVHLGGRKSTKSMLNVFRSDLTGLSLAFGDESWYLPVGHLEGNAGLDILQVLVRGLDDFKGTLAIHNLKHELAALARNPFTRHMPSLWEDRGNVVCTQVLAWLTQRRSHVEKQPYGLKLQAERYLGVKRPNFIETTGGDSFSHLKPKDGLDYACADAEDALGLYHAHMPSLVEDSRLEEWFWEIEMPTVWVLRHMEDRGMALDTERMDEVVGDLEQRCAVLEDQWSWLTNVSMTSGVQLQELFDQGIWTTEGVGRTKGGSWKTDGAAVALQLTACRKDTVGYKLAEIKHQHAELAKLASTYGRKLWEKAAQYEDLRLHPGINQTGTDTGRYSSSYPSIQNIPVRTEEGKRIREFFVAKDGCRLISRDYSQIELRVLAHYCGKGALFDGFHNGIDPHTATGEAMGRDRNAGKTGNFSILYGAGAKKVASQLGSDLREAKAFLAKMKESMPEVYATLEKAREAGEVRGRVRTLGGRFREVAIAEARRRFQVIEDSGARYGTSQAYKDAWGALGYEERKARNTPIQGSAADIVKVAMLAMYRTLDLTRTSMVAQIHDDIIQEADEDYVEEASRIQDHCMRTAWKLKVPLTADGTDGKRWSDLKEE